MVFCKKRKDYFLFLDASRGRRLSEGSSGTKDIKFYATSARPSVSRQQLMPVAERRQINRALAVIVEITKDPEIIEALKK